MRLLLLLAAGALSACAAMDPVECRGANWYDLGFRDAIFGLQAQDDLYETQCSPHGAPPDRERYREGWIDGLHELFKRQAHSVD